MILHTWTYERTSDGTSKIPACSGIVLLASARACSLEAAAQSLPATLSSLSSRTTSAGIGPPRSFFGDLAVAELIPLTQQKQQEAVPCSRLHVKAHIPQEDGATKTDLRMPTPNGQAVIIRHLTP